VSDLQGINNGKQLKKHSTADIIRFLIPSIFGILLFITPIKYQGNFTIGVGILAEIFQGILGAYLPTFVTVVIIISAVVTIIHKVAPVSAINNSKFFSDIFNITPFWMFFRVLGAILAVMTLKALGPEFVWSPNTGGTVLDALLPVLATWFFFSGFLMPLLLDFGAMDYTGIMIRRFMKPLFTIPGRSAIDCIASWIGSGTVGVVITKMQFDEGYYTAREASVIATCFSIASIAFSLVVATFMNLGHVFFSLYLTICLATAIAAVICPRIPPLKNIKDYYHPNAGKRIQEEVPEGIKRTDWALAKAVEKAAQVKGVGEIMIKGIRTVLDIYLNLSPLVMAWGTLALIIAEYTPVFTILSYPFVFILEWMQVPYAAEAAPALVVGFADMFLPAVFGVSIASEMTRFVIGAMAVTQLIYMTEVGTVILKSDIPLDFKDLVIVFLERTIITLPVVVAVAHLLY
jgi:nucleoside recognition membrane protein YjiH